LYKYHPTEVVVVVNFMSSNVASLIQYPLPCTECKAYTSKAAKDLMRDRKITCRVCSNVTRLSDQQLESLERTLQHMAVCGSRTKSDTVKEPQEEDELVD
jgi:predicted RNA-binding Zn ribbon-like protein